MAEGGCECSSLKPRSLAVAGITLGCCPGLGWVGWAASGVGCAAAHTELLPPSSSPWGALPHCRLKNTSLALKTGSERWDQVDHCVLGAEHSLLARADKVSGQQFVLILPFSCRRSAGAAPAAAPCPCLCPLPNPVCPPWGAIHHTSHCL